MKEKLLYCTEPVVLLALYFVLDWIADVRGPFMDGVDDADTVLYIAELLIAAFAIFSMWAAFNWFKNRPVLMRESLALSSALIIVEHFCMFGTNLLWLLAMIVVVYVSRFKVLTCYTCEP